MPELPEVENTKIQLQKFLSGKKIIGVKIFSPKQFLGDSRLLIGKKIKNIERRAKILIITFQKEDFSLFIHLKLTGQLIYSKTSGFKKVIFNHPIPFVEENTLPGKTTRIIFYLDKGTLFFNDLRKFGWIKIIKNSKSKAQNLNEFGIEPLSEDFTCNWLSKTLKKTKRPIKTILMDQKIIAGIGNIYANEALFKAGINPKRSANSLQEREIKKLFKSIILVLKEGIKFGGSSSKDEAYIRPDATPGSYQKYFCVYQRSGTPCPQCGTKITRINLGNRGTFFCPKCQR